MIYDLFQRHFIDKLMTVCFVNGAKHTRKCLGADAGGSNPSPSTCEMEYTTVPGREQNSWRLSVNCAFFSGMSTT